MGSLNLDWFETQLSDSLNVHSILPIKPHQFYVHNLCLFIKYHLIVMAVMDTWFVISLQMGDYWREK